MTTFATTFVSCSAVKVNVLFVLGCGRVVWLTVAAYVFWLLTTCCLNACFFLYSGHPLYDATCGPLQLAHFGFLSSLVRHPLWEWFSPQVRHFCLDLQFLAEWPKLWLLKHCVTETGDRNSSTSFPKFPEMRASASVGSLISSRKIGKTLSSFCFLSVQPWRKRFCWDQGTL